MTSPLNRPAATALLAVGPLVLLTACAEKSGGGGDVKSGTITVRADDDACKLSRTTAAAGSVTFKITNHGSRITEFYLYSPDDKVVSEVEGIGPGTSRTMAVKVGTVGKYATACKPGMVGNGIRGAFTVTAERH